MPVVDPVPVPPGNEAAAAVPDGVPGTLCADCRAPVSGHYCAACGQETLIETPTVGHFLREFADQYVALEGKLGRTLRVLLLRPGQLTLDYVEGRRQRYVRPLKLYLTISVVFFGLLGVLPDASNPLSRNVLGHERGAIVIDDRKDADAASPASPPLSPAAPVTEPGAESGVESNAGAAPPTPAGASAGKGRASAKPKHDAVPGSLEDRLEQRARAFAKLDPAEQNRVLREKLADDAPYAMFFLLPFFALLLKIFYRKTGQRYGVHLLFSLHLHSFVFLLLLLGFLPLPSLLRQALQFVALAYVFLALRHVYGGTIKRTLWRMFWLFTFYVVALSASAVSGILGALFGGNWA